MLTLSVGVGQDSWNCALAGFPVSDRECSFDDGSGKFGFFLTSCMSMFLKVLVLNNGTGRPEFVWHKRQVLQKELLSAI